MAIIKNKKTKYSISNTLASHVKVQRILFKPNKINQTQLHSLYKPSYVDMIHYFLPDIAMVLLKY